MDGSVPSETGLPSKSLNIRSSVAGSLQTLPRAAALLPAPPSVVKEPSHGTSSEASASKGGSARLDSGLAPRAEAAGDGEPDEDAGGCRGNSAETAENSCSGDAGALGSLTGLGSLEARCSIPLSLTAVGESTDGTGGAGCATGAGAGAALAEGPLTGSSSSGMDGLPSSPALRAVCGAGRASCEVLRLRLTLRSLSMRRLSKMRRIK